MKKQTPYLINKYVHVSKDLKALNETQSKFIDSILNKDITITTGPAGTGKTFVSSYIAASMLEDGKIDKLIICRPAIGVGEDLGHLPGTLNEKYIPWLAPIIEVLNERLGKHHVQDMIKSGKIECIPLMLMRGRSFKNSFILLDEAQNTTSEQMLMLITRMGEGSKIVIDGDISQSDTKSYSGLEDILDKIGHLSEVGVIKFKIKDIVRHGLIGKILKLYY
jgi:phosphate starvation-inducible protein PhoH and related proteins